MEVDLSHIWRERSECGVTGSGAFIVFEGIDGSGKSTQARLLVGKIESSGERALRTSEPSDGPIGEKIRSLSSRIHPDEEARLFAHDRRHHVHNIIIPALNEGIHVVCDRYLYSSLAYQGACGADIDTVVEMNREFCLRPDAVFILELPVEAALARIKSERIEGFSVYETLETLKAVDRIYKSLVDPLIVRIDARHEIERINHAVVENLRKGPKPVI